MKITLNQIKEKRPCEDGWELLLKGLNKTKADDEPFDVDFILKNNGLADFCWVLDKVLGKQKELRLFAYWNAKQCLKVVPKAEQEEYKKVINTVNLYAYGACPDSASASASASARSSAPASASASASARSSAPASASAWASASASAWASASASASASACDLNIDMCKYEAKLLKILKGDLPAIYKGSNHY